MKSLSNITFPTFEKGSVWLVGAGPGDEKLLTLFAWHALQNADVIVHDALVSKKVLALAPDKARLEKMGKRKNQPSPKQDEITARLYDLAQEGHKVLRLKGGDPFVFGRGAEEAIPLIKQNIPVRIIPGISAGIAGSAYAGIPVTDGASNQVISFVTGHDNTGNVPRVDWHALANSSPVIVFYMPMSQIDKIQCNLLEAGRKRDEPVCFVSNATTSNQQVCETTLGDCLVDAQNAAIKAPALMIIGPTIAFRSQLMECFN